MRANIILIANDKSSQKHLIEREKNIIEHILLQVLNQSYTVPVLTNYIQLNT